MKSFLKKGKLSEDMALQITSMADIFMILLVFLLKSTATSSANVTPTGDTRLPLADATGGVIRDSLKLEITSTSILVDQKEVIKLRALSWDPKDISPAGHSPALFRVLFEQRRRMPEPNLDSTLLVLADENTPYATLKPILASAANAGFVDLQLVVVQKE